MSEFPISGIIYSLILLVLIVPAYLGMRRHPKKEMRFFFVWLSIVAALVLGYSLLATPSQKPDLPREAVDKSGLDI